MAIAAPRKDVHARSDHQKLPWGGRARFGSGKGRDRGDAEARRARTDLLPLEAGVRWAADGSGGAATVCEEHLPRFAHAGPAGDGDLGIARGEARRYRA